jgi:hypothetical protein
VRHNYKEALDFCFSLRILDKQNFSRRRHNIAVARRSLRNLIMDPLRSTMKHLYAAAGRGRFFAVLLLVLWAAPVAFHRAEAHTAFDAPVVATAPEVATGTVIQVEIDDRVTQTTSTYRELELDDGSKIPLQGAAADSLQAGARVRVTGRRVGALLDVTGAETVAASGPSPTGAAATAVETQGSFAIAHADDFVTGKSRFIYQVQGDAGSVTTLSLASLPPPLRSGMRVIVSGQPAEEPSTLRPERITILSAPADGLGPKADLILKAATTNTVLVIMANFNNTVAPSFTAAQAQQVMSINTYGVANFYSDASYGQQLLNVTVTPSWVTMNLAASCSSFTNIGTAADAAALALGSSYNPSNYNFVVYLFPSQSCGWLGLAYVGFPHKAWINGTGAFTTQVVSHEMGHNFGLLHAGSINCGAASIGGSCSVAEYGDPFDTMGNQHAMHFNARQKSILNWIPAASVKTHTSGSASYTLTPIETAGGSTYAIKIPTSSSSRTYWIEYRQPLGFDSPSNPAANFSWPNNGAQIRVSSPFEFSAGSDDTEIVDMATVTPGNFADAALLVGQNYLDSTYGINITVTGASASALTVNVTTAGGAATTTALASAPNPSTFGTNVSLTATVTGSSPTGSVNFKDGATSITGCSAVALSGSGNSRTAACATAALTAGTHSIVAAYSGDAANAASSSSAVSQTVNKVSSTTAIGSSLTPSTAGASVTFTATVSGVSPTGSVNFLDGVASIGGCAAAALSGSGNVRTATCTTSSLAAATHSISAVYGGDANNNGSTSATLSQVVNKATSSTALASSLNPSTVGAGVTFTATVSGFAPTGSVNFTDGGSSISGCATVALSGSGNSRTAQCNTSALSVATHSIGASYVGDANNASSVSTTLSQVVNNTTITTSTTALSSSVNPSVAGASVTFTATVSGSSPTGSVNFRDGATSIGGCAVVALAGSGNVRTATCPTSSFGAASHSISASYGGDAGNTASTSATLSQVVNKATSSTALTSSLNPATTGAAVAFTATVSGFAPTGSVNFTDGGSSISGCATVALSGSGNSRTAHCSTSALAAATHSIVASYAGDANNNASASATLSQVVNASVAPALVNPSFEIPALGSGYQYNPSPAGIGWTFSAYSGIQGNGSAWGAKPTPAGTQTAFLQMTGSIAQAVNLNAGTYTISFQAAQRPCCVAPYVQPVKVTLDGVQIGSLISPASTSFSGFSVTFSVAANGTHTIMFAGTDPSDKTTFIDNVMLTAGTSPVTFLTLASSANPAKVSQSVTFTASASGNNPSGSVAFTNNGSTIAGCGTVALGGSGSTKTAACTTTFAATGTFNIVANYGGDANNAAATSPVLAEVIKRKRR